MKSTVSLDARIFDTGKNKNPPIAPPRKKRTTLKKGSTLPSTMPSDVVRNGFKDVFGNTSISSIDEIDFIDKDENSLQERPMAEQRTSTPEKKLRVGNKKTDKFFGEALSDHLSDEPVSPVTEKETEVREVESLEDSKSISDKKLSFFLMNMLDDIRNAEDEEKYKGKTPVDEPPFVARKRQIKHICDDDDHMHHMHDHERDSHEAPPKPDRDFSKFKPATLEVTDALESPKIVEKIEAKVIIRRGLSRDNLPSPPATPSRKKGVANMPNTPTITIETIDASIDRATVESNKSKDDELRIDKNLTEFVDQAIKKAYGMSDFNYNPEDMAHHTNDDGSNLVRPTSKLAVRKISTPRKISTESAPSVDSESLGIKTPELVVPSTPYKKSSFCENEVKLNQMLEEGHAKFYEIDQAARVPSPLPRVSEKHFASSSVNDIIDEIYSRNSDIMKEFQSYLEQSIETKTVIDVVDENKFLEAKKSLEDNVEDPVKDIHDEDFDNRHYSDSFESSEDEQDIIKVNIEHKATVAHSVDNRKASIEDVDNWFSNHIETDQTESEVCNSLAREPAGGVGYDTNKIFPFGPTITGRRDSMSDDFFSETSSIIQRMKHNIETVQVTDSSIKEEPEKEQKVWQKESSPDHSTLLKYLDKSNTDDIKN